MRHLVVVLLVIGVGTSRATAQERADPAPATPAQDSLGRVAWFDITTTDLKRSEVFYQKLLGWTFAGEGDQFATIVCGRTKIGTLRHADGKISPFNGVVYIEVADMRQSCAKAVALGAILEPGFPFDLPDGSGAIGLIRDPAGHPLGLYAKALLAPTHPHAP